MLFYIFMVFASCYSNVCSFIISMNGINIRYGVTSYATCMAAPASSRLFSVTDVSVSMCLHKCAIRQNCVGLNYKRKFKLCDLLSGDGSLENSIDCIYISRNDIVLQNSSCVEVCDGQQKCDQDGKCSEKVNPGCNYPEVLNGHPLGNMMNIGGTQAIECDSGFIRRGSRTIKCMDNGSWDTIPECLKECNISGFHNANIEMLTNSSGLNALVKCHEKYISNSTTSGVDVITEETVDCDSNGNWIPNIDCIYFDNLFNLALKKTATHSSTYQDYVAERATDGIWDYSTFLGLSCSRTIPNETMSWLEIDLQQTYTIRRVKILYCGYGSFSSNSRQVTVTIGNQSNPANICGIYESPANYEQEYTCSPALTGRYVRLNEPETSHYSLCLCEVGYEEMADVESLRRKRKFRNYISSVVATYKVGVALEHFTTHGLQAVHDHIRQRLGNQTVCQNQCSKNNRDIQRWCVTCTNWRNELETFFSRRLNRVQWHGMKSWCWPNSPQDIAEVFVLPGWPTNNINLQDVSTIFNVWNRCSSFNRNAVQVLAQLKENRNELIHNTTKMLLTNAKKKAVFQNIKNVINHTDIRPLILNHANLSQLVRDLEKGSKLFADDIQSSLRQIGRPEAEIKDALNGLSLEIRNTNRVIRRLQRDLKIVLVTASVFCVFAFIILSILMSYTIQRCIDLQQPSFPTVENKESFRLTSTNGCLPETTENDDLGRISLFEYISHHEKFTGRDWLIKIIDTELRQDRYRGILLEAGMGYGKSALMKHIICAPEESLAHRLRRRLLAFHVCRFDVIVSKQAHIFVRRLISMISSQIPSLAHEINSCKKIFDIKMCEKDSNGCLDQCVMIPLKRYSHFSNEPFIIAIDALDECYDDFRGQNEILNLLKQRLHRFSPWIKFLISTRPNQRGLKYLAKDTLFLKLEDESENNVKDIEKYLQQYNNSAPYFSTLANTKVKNFRLLTLLLEIRTETVSTIPITLDRYYDEEFNRIFGSGKNAFVETKQILEVMCTTFQSPTTDNLWNVLSSSTNISFKQFEKALQIMENFIRKINGEFHIVHESILHWLRSPENEHFFVDIENGHKVNAMYFFKLIDDGHCRINIVDLAIHVDFSSESFLRTRFKDLSESQVKCLAGYSNEYPILELAKRVDRSIATELLVLHFREVERRNKSNYTALFIAASLGHLKTFEALIKCNSNVAFRTDSYNDIINFENASRASFEHMFWGYGILDIAAQNGHSNIVRYILKNNLRLFDYALFSLNAMMLLPIHLACKKGHSEIVEQLHRQYRWMLDWQCLYYASENGKIDLVKYILENNVRDQCRICTTHIHWIPKGHLRVQGQMVYPKNYNYTYVLFDDWNNITCESALHVAVRENNLDVVKLLIRNRQNTIKCVDRGGRTPFLSAVQYGYRDIVEYFVELGHVLGNETCSTGIHLTDNSRLHENEVKRLEEYICGSNMSLAHIVAKYDRKWVVAILHLYGVEIDWNVTDINGCFPSHIASCHGSLEILKIIVEKFSQTFQTFNCLNGSNPLHSAVSCASVTATEFLLLRYDHYESESKLVKMSYIKHAILRETNALLARDIADLEKNTATIISMLVTEESDLHIKDELNRTILHYAIQKGHFQVVKYLLSHNEKTANFLVKAVDNSKRNPLYYAIHHLEPYSKYFIPVDFWNDVLAEPLERMSAKEYSLLLTFDFLIKIGRPKIDQRLLKQLVRRGCLHIIIFLIEHSEKFLMEKYSILPAIIENDRHGVQLFGYLTTSIRRFSRISIVDFRNMIRYTDCQELRSKYHLHLLALNYLKVSNFLSILDINFVQGALCKMIFPEIWASLMSMCYDGEDFNVLERAVQGGSSHLVRHLIKAGVSTDLKKVNLVNMALSGLKYRSENKYFAFMNTPNDRILQVSYIKQDRIIRDSGSNQVYSYKVSLLTNLIKQSKDFLLGSVTFDRNNLDVLVSELLTYYKHEIEKSDICLPVTRQFSAIHRLAFDGLLRSVKLAVKYWGKSVLLCKNTDGFTPLFMSTVFQNKHLGKYILNHDIKLKAPVEKAETYFYFKLRLRYFFAKDEMRHIKCIMAYAKNAQTTTYRAIKAFNCAKKVVRKLSRKDLMEKAMQFKWDLAFFIEKSTWNNINIRIRRIKLFLQNNSVSRDTYMRYIQIFEAERRICNYLRISYKEMLLKLQKYAANVSNHLFLKEMLLHEIKHTLADIDLYKWNTTNCSLINDFFLKRAFRGVSKHIQETLSSLRIRLLEKALKEQIFLHPLGQNELKFEEILKNPNMWFRLYHHYDYMNELQTSTSYRESYFFRIEDEKIISSYLDDVKRTFTFISWSNNAAKMLESYLKEKRKA